MTLIPRCDGCGGDVEPKSWPRVVGRGASNTFEGGPVAVRPGQRFDLCAGCTTVAATAVAVHQDLIRAMRAAKILDNQNVLRLREYLRDPLSPDDLGRLLPMTPNERTIELQRRYGGPLNWRVAQVALNLHLQRITA